MDRSATKRPLSQPRSLTSSHRRGPSQSKHQSPIVTRMRFSDTHDALSVPISLVTPRLKACLKQIGGEWCQRHRVYLVKRMSTAHIEKELEEGSALVNYPPLFVDLAAGPTPQKITIRGKTYSRNQAVLKSDPVFNNLCPYQMQAVQFCIEQHGRVLIADQDGLGKSQQALACALAYRHYPVLIVCPRPFIPRWKQDCLRWLRQAVPLEQIKAITDKSQLKTHITASKVIIVPYDLLSLLIPHLTRAKVDNVALICDEAHYLNQYLDGHQKSNTALSFVALAERLILISAKPLLHQPQELLLLLQLLRPDIFASWEQFLDRYCYIHLRSTKDHKEYSGSKNILQLEYILRRSVMISRSKAQVLDELPPQSRQIVNLPTHNQVTSQIKAKIVEQLSIESLIDGQGILSLLNDKGGRLSLLQQCMKLSWQAKRQSVKAYLSFMIESMTKFVVIALTPEVLDEIATFMHALKSPYTRINHTLSVGVVNSRMIDFHDTTQVALVDYRSAPKLDLTVSSIIVYAEMPLSPVQIYKAEQCVRPRQRPSHINLHYLVGQNTLDCMVIKKFREFVENREKARQQPRHLQEDLMTNSVAELNDASEKDKEEALEVETKESSNQSQQVQWLILQKSQEDSGSSKEERLVLRRYSKGQSKNPMTIDEQYLEPCQKSMPQPSAAKSNRKTPKKSQESLRKSDARDSMMELFRSIKKTQTNHTQDDQQNEQTLLQ